MERKKVLIAEKVNIECIKGVLEPHVQVDVKLDLSREELLREIKEYDGLIVRSSTKVNKELFSKAEKLKVVGRAGNGIDNIDIDEATKKGIVVANTPDSNSISACELTIGLLLASARNIYQASSYLKAGKWDRKRFIGSELYNKTLGIIGLGRIGGLVAARMAAFDMNIIAYDPYIPDERFERFKATKKETLEELLAESDFITIHTPKTSETIGMIGEDQIKKMKDGVRIVNVARGGIIDEKALLQGLKSQKVVGAGLDVHENEPSYDNPLFELYNTVVTPHIGASTLEAQQNVGETIAKQVLCALEGEVIPNAINLPTLNRHELKVIKPYLDLMEKLGKIYYQLYTTPIDMVDINYYGSIANQDVEMITVAFLKGLLEPVIRERVNYVNAKLIAKQRGIVINERKINENYKGYTDLIKVKIKSKDILFTLSGNLSTKNEGRLIEILGYEVDVTPSKHMLFIQNRDIPGMVGKIGTVLGRENINIASMQVGRLEIGEKALMVLNVDNEVSMENIDKVKKIDNIISAKKVKL
ncbi:phosphoglycerate dehydrogenase [Paramaledivibacter caminithermalis]|jgi:D-3-phosphoglycerate dehydrogenase|uniref:D-3-phosphoglycerate dehydrogenase n=1 Tax=Paramaledivibacter caminithermalis (strain DSM 15212 / CIP 107654 / DViRD3) TaxID=1121301 RepID=A0A1M6Q621_PARC5|nr:phosphoglycerate dehydrogenase [Paramaledivibacter caminithermalis]SHK15635.1 D-3-phosphoglycerate dehydrogenase [Paramaledivibacter caminithermalis DSM 15212]